MGSAADLGDQTAGDDMTIPVKMERETVLRPTDGGRRSPKQRTPTVRLTVFDNVTYNTNLSVIFAYRAPTVSNAAIIDALRDVLAEYPEWAGRIDLDDGGGPAILLNDNGIWLAEATSDTTLHRAIPSHPSPALAVLHPSREGSKELLQVQLTRFACGGLALGLTAHHLVADGQATCLFWVTWGRAVRGLKSQVVRVPPPFHDRSLFVPRDPPRIEFKHFGVEYQPPAETSFSGPPHLDRPVVTSSKNIVIQRTRFSAEFIRSLKAKVSSEGAERCTTFETLVAHLWRLITISRMLDDYVTTRLRISVNGRTRLRQPSVPDGYFGNCVLWAFPEAKANDLRHGTTQAVARIIHEAVATVDDGYFRSFIDFSEVHGCEGLVPTAEMENRVLCPNLEVDSWVRLPLYEVDFGSGGPDVFTPSWLPYEGFLILLPTPGDDDGGGVDVLVPLHEQTMARFAQMCYDLNL